MSIVARMRQAGQSLVEFAAIASLLFLIVFGILEFSRAYFYYNTVLSAAEEGARYGIVNQNTACVTQVALQRVVAVGMTSSDVTVTCLNDAGATGSSYCSFGNRIQVGTSYTFSPIVSFIPSLPLAATATMRIGRTNNNSTCN
ncbi:MAG: pilus assembly protein [Chloroflexi bacterium]|nr:pilus assembly protein [Chloroflexota bacterium]